MMKRYEIEFLLDDSLSPSAPSNKVEIGLDAESMDDAEIRAFQIVRDVHPDADPVFWGGRLIK